MKIKCDFCSSTYEDTLPECPSCGAPNPVQKTVLESDPKTIEELQAWYHARNLPPADVTRFYIGIDYRNPKAFGIYEADDGDIVVYKNKADGTRAIRYKGKDEAYAVNELLLKLKEEIVRQKLGNKSGRDTVDHIRDRIIENPLRRMPKVWRIAIICVILFYTFGCIVIKPWNNGYYNYNDSVYYKYNTHWYTYSDTYDDWYEVDGYSHDVDAIQNDYDTYYVSRGWDSSIGASDWNDTSYYSDTHSDSDYDWDSGSSWDSGGDWDSDW